MGVPLNIDWQQILLHLFNFVLLAGGLYFLLYAPVRNFMEKRAGDIAAKEAAGWTRRRRRRRKPAPLPPSRRKRRHLPSLPTPSGRRSGCLPTRATRRRMKKKE